MGLSLFRIFLTFSIYFFTIYVFYLRFRFMLPFSILDQDFLFCC